MGGFKSYRLHSVIKQKVHNVKENSLKWTTKQMQRINLSVLILAKYGLITALKIKYPSYNASEKNLKKRREVH